MPNPVPDLEQRRAPPRRRVVGAVIALLSIAPALEAAALFTGERPLATLAVQAANRIPPALAIAAALRALAHSEKRTAAERAESQDHAPSA